MSKNTNTATQTLELPLTRLLFTDTRFAWVWLPLRLYIGWQWFQAGHEKISNPLWVGPKAGGAIQDFLMGALKKTGGQHPDVLGWYGIFIKDFALHHTVLFSYLVSYGEFLVGIALILGIFTGLAAFFGGFMNINYLFAGTISTNPLMFLVEIFLILAWRIAGRIGLDRYVIPLLGAPRLPRKMTINRNFFIS